MEYEEYFKVKEYSNSPPVTFFHTRAAISLLLEDGVLRVFNRPFIENSWKPEDEWVISDEKTITLEVMCNDLFAWGVADCETVTVEERITDFNRTDDMCHLLKLYLENGSFGIMKWCCMKRNMQPQAPIVEWMKEDGYWDDIMESLPLNSMDDE